MKLSPTKFYYYKSSIWYGMERYVQFLYQVFLQDEAKRFSTTKINCMYPVSQDMLIRFCDMNVDSSDLLVVRDLA